MTSLLLSSISRAATLRRWLLLGLVGAAPLAGAQAQTVYGLGTQTQPYLGNPAGVQGLVPINSTTGVAASPFQVLGVAAAQSLVGMDFRPSNGLLYALGYDSVAVSPAPNAQLYTISTTGTTTGTVTAVGSAMRLELGRRTARIGFDFNPVADLIRITSTNRANYRLNPATGAIAGTDTNLAYASGTPAVPGIGAVAYSNSFPGAATTTLYAFDELNNGLLSVVNPPNAGTLTSPVTVMFQGPSGNFGVGSPSAIDFDIYANTATNSNDGYLVEVTAGGSSNLYRLNLTTGQGVLVGNIVPSVVPFPIRDIAVAIGGTLLATAPATLAQLASLYPNPAHGTATLNLPTTLRGSQATAVSVVDNLGRVVLRRTLGAGTAETIELPLGALSPGIYSVQANTAVGTITKRLAVE